MKKYYSLIILTVLFSLTFTRQLLAGINISTTTTTSCQDSLYDNAGPSGNYTNNRNDIFTIAPTNAVKVKIFTTTFAFGTGDTVFIYDGSTTASPVLAALRASSANPGSVTSTGTTITVRLKTNNSSVGAGFKFYWQAVFTPSVSISSTPSLVCVGSQVTFTVTDSTSGGNNPSFAWYKNGIAVGSNSHVYTVAPANADQIKVVMTRDLTCGIGDPANTDTSSIITITTTDTVTAAVSVTSSLDSICAGDSITFTATPTNGGSSPVYSWTVNGGAVGSNSPTFTTASLLNGDDVVVTMASDMDTVCLTDSISMDTSGLYVQAITTASVSVVADDASPCIGADVLFTATPTNGGATPVYSWTLNGSPVGSNSTTYTDSSFVDNDVVKVTMASDFSGGCLADSISSDSIVLDVVNYTTSSVSVIASDASICDGDNVLFTATPTNGGASPVYSWKLNGGAVGSNSTTYNNSTLNHNDEVKVTMASGVTTGCVTDSISSDSVTISVQANTTVSVNVTTSDPSVCSGTNVTFTAAPTNGGGSPVYAWTRNGSSVGTNSANFSTTVLTDNDKIKVTAASSLTIGCLIDSVTADSLIMNINPNPTASVISSIDVDCFGNSTGSATASGSGGTEAGTYVFLWNDFLSQSTTTASNLDPGFYTVTITDDSSCIDTDTITIAEPSQLDINFTVTNVSTFGGNDGEIGALAVGGTPYNGIGQDGYYHNWKTGQGTGHTTTRTFTHTISGLFSNWYVDTVTDNNGCKFIDSAFVSQPTQLTGGEIKIGGTLSKKVCDGATVGLISQTQASVGGIGTKTYTWQRSIDLLNWTNFPSSNSTSYTYNDTILTTVFVRRRVTDQINDSNHSNIIFLNYIPDVLINIIGLNAQYCDVDAEELIFGSPNAPGIGWFSNSAYMDSATKVFSPVSAVSDADGEVNNILYNYVDQFGCYSSDDASTIVYKQDTGHIWMDKTIFTIDEDRDTIYNSFASGSFLGVGVYQSSGIWYFDPGLVDSSFIDSTINILFQYTNPSGCVTNDTLVINMISSQFALTTNLSVLEEFSGCFFDSLLTVYAKPGLGDTVINYYYYYYNEDFTNYYYDGNFYSTFTTAPLAFNFNPKMMTPCCFNTQTTPTPTGVSKYHFNFIYYTTSNPFSGFQLARDLEVVHLDKVKINPDQLNSDGSATLPLQYCVNVADVAVSSQVYPLPGRNTAQAYSISPIISGQFISDTSGNGVFYPPMSGAGNRQLKLTYTDELTGCAKDTTYPISVSPLPVVNLVGMPDTNCANDGVITFHGSPYLVNRGNFTSPTGVSLGLTHINGDSTAIITAQGSNVGAHKVKYTYQHTTGCIRSDSTLFNIYALPVMSMNLAAAGNFNSSSICVTDTSELVITASVVGQLTGQVGDSIVGPGITYPFNSNAGQATFNASAAGVGNHTIRFYYTDNIGCSNFVDSVVTVNGLPNPSFITSTNDYNTCNVLGDNLNFSYTGGATGTSEYRIDGSIVTLFAPVANANIDFGPNDVVHKFTQTSTTCVNYDTVTITVDAFPVVSISGINATYCHNDASITFTGSPASPGGASPSYFFSPIGSFGFTDQLTSFGETSGSFTANASHVGSHTISYNYTHPITGCFNGDTFQLDILDIPQLEVKRMSAPLSPLVHCLGDTVHYLKLSNGVKDLSAFSFLIGPGFADSASNVFDPDLAGVSTGPNHHSLVYKSKDPNGCYNEIDTTVVVLATSDASFAMSDDTACIDPVGTITITPSFVSGNFSKFYYHGTQKPGQASLPFYLDSATVGVNQITYIYDDGTGCSDTNIRTITVNDTPSVSISNVVPEYCMNQGQFTAFVNQPSIGNSYFRSYHFNGAIRTYNDLLDSSILGNGVDSVQFVPFVVTGPDTLVNDDVYLEYIHIDANGCEGVGTDALFINDLPTLVINTNNADNAICATQEQITLQGVADGVPNLAGGSFTGSLIGVANNYVANTTNSNGTFGTVPVDSFFTDTVYYHFTDLDGCYNRQYKTINIIKLPPPFFMVDSIANHSSDKSICPDETGTTTSYYDNCDTCKNVLWPTGATKLVRRWYVNDSIRTAIAAGKFTPGTGPSFDLTFYNSFNTLTQQMWDNRWLPSCYIEYTDSIYLDTFPVVDVIKDTIYCSNEGSVTFKGSPASPGTSGSAQPSVFSSPDMEGGFNTPLTALGLDSIVKVMDSLTPGTLGGYKPYNLKYEYTDPNTGCKSSKQEVFQLKTRPVLSMSPSSITYCPYDAQDTVTLTQNGNDASISGTVITGQGLVGPMYAPGKIVYKPTTFLGDTNTVNDVITYTYTDADTCSYTLVNTGFVVKHQPILNLIIDTSLHRPDSVCFDDPAVNLTIQYLDTSTNSFTDYGGLFGPSSPGDDNYFNFEINSGVYGQPYSGPVSKQFVPKWDSKGDSSGVVTNIRFIGTYSQIGFCADTIIKSIVTHPKPVASFYLDGTCSKYAPVMHGDSSFNDTASFSPTDGMMSYIWQVDDSIATVVAGGSGDTLVDYTYKYALDVDNHDISLIAKSKKGCYSDKLLKEYAFVASPDASFTWDMDEECDGSTVEFRSTSKLNGATVTYFWDFGDGNSSTDSIQTQHQFAGTGKYSVLLELQDGIDCKDTVVKDFYVRPNISSYPYLDKFDSLYSGWVVWKQAHDSIALSDTSDNYEAVWFEWGQRNTSPGNVNTLPLDNAWCLGYNIDSTTDTSAATYNMPIYHNLMQTSVISPCFSFASGIERPMLTLETTYNFEPNDGAVVQYTTDTGKSLEAVVWKNIGEYYTKNNVHYNTGINWYNKENIFGSPGKQSDADGKIGWSNTNNTLTYTPWKESRHEIDEVMNKPYVRFRIAFGSNADGSGEGFIFDDFGIRRRERNVVFETFTNSSQSGYKSIMEGYDAMLDSSRDVLDIQYHTSFPESDPMNQDNTSDPSARALYYGISEVPFVIGNGTEYSEFIQNPTTDFFTLKPEALNDPKFYLGMSMNPSTDEVNVKFVPTATEFVTKAVDVILYVALVERSVHESNFADGAVGQDFQNYNFRNVLKRLYPSAAGTAFTGLFTNNDTSSFNTMLLYENFYTTADSFRVIAFVQDKKTKYVYQANYLEFGRFGTGQEEYENLVTGGVEYNLYPNPTAGLTNMQFTEELTDSYQLSVYNQLGVLVLQDIVAEGTRMHTFDISNLTPGMYFVMLNDSNQKVAIKRLVLTK